MSTSKVKAIRLVESKPVPVVRLTLDLTEKDAVALLTLTGVMGGSPDTTTRGVFDKIDLELTAAGFKSNPNSITNHDTGRIFFAARRGY
jgi:hypothetical protein